VARDGDGRKETGMDLALRDRFVDLWRTRFGSAELPIACYYTGREDAAPPASVPAGHRCLIALLAQVRGGRAVRVDARSAGCGGAKRYLGFTQELAPQFEYFLSCGIPGKLAGERYKQSPELVKDLVQRSERFVAPSPFLVFKRWDSLEATDTPEVVVFLARPDVLAGLFTLANYDEAENSVIAPFGAGCGSIVQHAYLEARAPRPRAVLGMFDVSARPYVPADTLSFAVPMQKFQRMVANMDQSFLITPSWTKVRQRMS
jgi:hypothetical protein